MILELLEDANREAIDVQSTPRGLLRVAAPVSFGAMRLGGIISQNLDTFPGGSLDVFL